MKFCHQLDEQRKLSPVEWGPFFLNYKLLKKKIKSMTNVEKYHKPSATTPEALSSSQSEVEFFRMMDYEIRRGTQFLALSEGQYVLKTRTVLDGYRSTQHLLQSPMLGLEAMLTKEAAAEMWIRLMRVCISVYTELLLLNHWVVVSYCGFSKILKKHDRWTGFMTKEKYLRYVVAKQHFTSYPKLHAMLRDMEALYLHILRRLPLCAERTEVEAKMDSAKCLVATAGLEFAKYTGELTRSIERDTPTYGCSVSSSSMGQNHKREEAELLDGGTNAIGGATAPPPPLLVASGSSSGGSDGGGGGLGGDCNINAQATTLDLREKETPSEKGKRRRVSVDTPPLLPETVDWFEEFGAEIGQRGAEEEDGDIMSPTAITTATAAITAPTAADAATATDTAASSKLVEGAVGRVGGVGGGGGNTGVDGVPEMAGVTIVVAVQRRDPLGSAHHAVLGSEAGEMEVGLPAGGKGLAPAGGMGEVAVAKSFEASAPFALGREEKE